MNTAVNMNNTTNMNGGYGMNNVVYFNGVNNMNYMNNQYMGMQVNQELVSFLEECVKTFTYYEEFCSQYNEAKEKDEAIQNKLKKITNKWRWIIVGAPLFAFSLVSGTEFAKMLIAAGVAGVAVFAKSKIKPIEEQKAMIKCQESNEKMNMWKEQKAQLDINVGRCFGYVQEAYRSSYIMSYMLDLAKAGRVQDLNQAYMRADEELHRLSMEATQLAMMEEQQDVAKTAAVGGAVVAGAGAILGSFLGLCYRNS
ncbi:MAG: hypothetical protein J6A25_09985 [Lachnospiraceae bacterium]|nr:hypothetical protein [Lachnospiraceae bacterium]